MTTEQLVEQLQRALGAGLKSVVLYGSAAAGDFVEGVSSRDILIVADQMGARELAALVEPLARWQKAGNPQPQLFTAQELAASADAFPIELLDMQQSRQVLFGNDPLSQIKIDTGNLRLQLEHELMSRLLLLRRKYLTAGGKSERVARLLAESVSTFLVLFRAALRLYDGEVPAQKVAALQLLAERFGFDPQPFLTVLELKKSKAKRLPAHTDALFSDYLNSLEKVVRAVDQRLHPSSS